MQVERISEDEAEEKMLKLEYRLAQIQQVESCQQEFELCHARCGRILLRAGTTRSWRRSLSGWLVVS